MKNPELDTIIKSAIAQEELSHDFYRRMADLVNHIETRETFNYLAKEELEHKEFLEGCFTEKGCALAGEVHNVHLAELLQAPSINENLAPKEALVIAMKREESSHNFYKTLANLQPPGEIRNFLENMARVELSHKEKIEYLYDNVAFPEVW